MDRTLPPVTVVVMGRFAPGPRWFSGSCISSASISVTRLHFSSPPIDTIRPFFQRCTSSAPGVRLFAHPARQLECHDGVRKAPVDASACVDRLGKTRVYAQLAMFSPAFDTGITWRKGRLFVLAATSDEHYDLALSRDRSV